MTDSTTKPPTYATIPEILAALHQAYGPDHLTVDEVRDVAETVIRPLSEIACAAIRWALADRVADVSADLVNALEREEIFWHGKAEEKGVPSLSHNTWIKIRKELEIAKLALADACEHEASCERALKLTARGIAPPAPVVSSVEVTL